MKTKIILLSLVGYIIVSLILPFIFLKHSMNNEMDSVKCQYYLKGYTDGIVNNPYASGLVTSEYLWEDYITVFDSVDYTIVMDNWERYLNNVDSDHIRDYGDVD